MLRPQTRSDLWLFVRRHFGLPLPYRSFTPGHSTPLDFIADAFFNPGRDLAVWANRGGLKTLCASILAALEFRFTGGPLRGRVLSGSEDQARNLYEYWLRWCRGILADRIEGKAGRQLTRVGAGDFEILATSQKQVRGAKIQRLFRDEVEEIDPEVLAASVGMLASIDDLPARTIDTSTWHRAHGPMSRLVGEAERRGIRLHKWNLWEALRQCPRERHQGGRGCRRCRLADVCLAKARQVNPRATVGIASRCCGLLAIDDAIKQLSHWSLQQWQAEAECKRPTLQGLVYPQFNRAVHVKGDLDFAEDLPTFRAIDWGLSSFVCLWIQEDKTGAVYVVDEYWAENATVGVNAEAIHEQDGRGRVEATYCDPAGRNRSDQTGYSDVQQFQARGIPCRYRLDGWARQVGSGIGLIRAHLQPACGKARLFVAGRCRQTIRAFESYRLRKVNAEYVDEPVKPQEYDHPMDALRYYFVNRHGPAQVQAGQMGYS